MRKKKNLLFFIGELGSGGAERVLMEILKHLDREKYTLTVVVNRAGGYFYDKLPDDVTLIDRSLIRKSKYDLYDRIYGLPKIIKQQKADLVVAVMQGAGRSLMRSRILIDRKVKLVIRIGNNPKSHLFKNQTPFWNRIEKFETTHFFPKADSTIAISSGIKEALIEDLNLKPRRVDMIHNPVDVQKLQRLKKVKSDDSRLDDVEDLQRMNKMKTSDSQFSDVEEFKKLVAIGRLIPEKGYDEMIRVFQKVRSEIPCKLTILGDGPLRADLQSQIDNLGLQGDINMTGFVENPWSYLDDADLYLTTSRSEGFHLTIVEAMACGVVPVATNCDYGPREIITDGVDGRLVPVDDTKAIADAVIELLQNPEKRQNMVIQALKRAQNFDISVVVREYEALIDELIEV